MTESPLSGLFRPPFHIPVELMPECRTFAALCNKFFSLSRTLESFYNPEFVKNSAMFCKDDQGWYLFGRPGRFPLTSAEINTCDKKLEKELNLFIDQIETKDSNTLHKKFSCNPEFTRQSDEVLVFHLGTIEIHDSRLNDRLIAVAVFPTVKDELADSLKRDAFNDPNVIESILAQLSTPTGLPMSWLELLGKTVHDVVPAAPKIDFDIRKSLNSIANDITEQLGVKICSVFVRESMWDPPFITIKRNFENLGLLGVRGYDTERTKNIKHKIIFKENQPDRGKKQGITVSICLGSIDDDCGKIVILNHRLEIGGYDPSKHLLQCKEDIKDTFNLEAESRGIAIENIKNIKNIEKLDLDDIKAVFQKARPEEGDIIYRNFGYKNGIIKDPKGDPSWIGLLDNALDLVPCRTLLGIPIIIDGVPVGCVKIEGADVREGLYEADRFTFQELVFLDVIAGIVANILNSAKVMFDWRVSTIDRRVYTNDSLAEIYKVQKSRCSVIFIDVDDFKNINETAGYEGGNEVLRKVSQALCNCLNELELSDTTKVARWGGDEFLIVFPAIPNNYEEKMIVADMLGIIANKLDSIRLDGFDDLIISASLGFATEEGQEGLKNIIEKASIASRVAKWSGKNKLINYQDIKRIIIEQKDHKIIKKYSSDQAVINIGLEHGVQPNFQFEVKAPYPVVVDGRLFEDNFDLSKAYARVKRVYKSISTVQIEQASIEVEKDDPVILRT